MARRTERRTATDAYRATGVEVETLMEAIGDALERHHAAHQANPADWGYVGDLSHVRELLRHVVAFLPKAGA